MKRTSVLSALLKSIGFIFLFLISQALSSLLCEGLILSVFLKKGLEGNDLITAVSTAMNKNIYVIMLISYLLFLGITVLLLRKNFLPSLNSKKTSFSSLITSLLMGFGAYPVGIVLYNAISTIPAVAKSQENYAQQQELITNAGGNLIFELLAICIIGPIFEEILFRGLILTNLKKAMPAATAIFLTGLAFGIVHGNLYQLTFTLPLGIFMSFLAHRFQSLFPSIMMHIAFNSSNYLPRLGIYLGYGEEHPFTQIFYRAAFLFYPFALILSVLLYKTLFGKKRSFADFQNFLNRKNKWFHLEENDFMAAPEYLVVGLGNPGAKYEKNRHNVGFLALDYIAEKENVKINTLRFKALCGESTIDGKKVLFLKPQTFMNLSGESVREAAAFYKIPPEKILIIFDDISFIPGVFRIREKGSAGGHNGIKSIISCLGCDNFPRVKVGVGACPEGWDLMHHVLGNLVGEDMKKTENAFPDIHSTVCLFIKGDLNRAGALFNGKEH